MFWAVRDGAHDFLDLLWVCFGMKCEYNGVLNRIMDYTLPELFVLELFTGTRPEKIRLQKWYTIYKDHITLDDYEVHDGCVNGSE